MKPFHTQEFDNIIQHWFELDVNEYSLYKDPKSKPEKTTKRVFGISYSNKIKDKCKHPFLLNLDFNIAGKAQGWGAKKNVKVKDKTVDQYTNFNGYGGIIKRDSDTEYLYEGANIVGFRYLQYFYREVMNQNIVIIHTSMVADDSYFYAECKNRSKEYILDDDNLCWYTKNEEFTNDNPDLDYLKHLFDIIYDSSMYPLLNFDLDYSKMSIFGYSVGAQAASRYMNNFPLIRTNNNYKFPDINSVIMLAGGSYECYNDSLYNNKMFINCTKERQNKNGCCPENFTEENYMNGTLAWKNHPPVLCIQQLNDFYADAKASVYYINELKKHNVICERLTSYGYQHGFANNNQVNYASEFIKNNLENNKNNLSKNKKFKEAFNKNNNNSFYILITILLIVSNIFVMYKLKNIQSYIILFVLLMLLLSFLTNNRNKQDFNNKEEFSNLKREDFIVMENFGKKNKEKKKKENQNKENQNNKSKSTKEYTKDDIVDLYNNNGLLITMNSTKLYCPQFVEQLLKYDESGNVVSNCPFGQTDVQCKCVKPNECDIFDVGDLKKLLTYNFDDAHTMCFALDTTLIQYNLMPLVFGPYLNFDGTGESFQIGIILDYNKLKNYIACAYSFDSSSIARTPPLGTQFNVYDNDTAKKCTEEAKKITDDDINNGKIHKYKDGIVSKNYCPATVMAGCINFNGEYKPQIEAFDVRDSNKYQIEKCKDITDEWCFTSTAFSDSLTNPFYKGTGDGMKLFIEQTKKIQNILGPQARPLKSEIDLYNEKSSKDYDKNNPKKISGDYFAYEIKHDIEYSQNNGNSEKSEKNIKIGWGNNGYRENEIDLFIPQKENADVENGKCDPTEKIKEIWENSIIGIFTNNVCFQDIKYNNIKNNRPRISQNCCNTKFNEELVLELVKKYNSTASKNRNKIHGYVIETFKPDERIESSINEYPLNIHQIPED